MRIGLVGLGVVGSSVIKILQEQKNSLACKCGSEIEIIGVSAINKVKDRGVDISSYNWFDNPLELAALPQLDCLVELVGGCYDGISNQVVDKAISSGKHVVTANKALLARHGHAFFLKAEAANVSIRFEAAVAGAIPVVRSMSEGLISGDMHRISGVLNGTCNYILTQMELESLEYGDALKVAQKLGYAESNPTDDVDGYDAAYKLIILSSLGMGTPLLYKSIKVEGISGIGLRDIRCASMLGYKIRLIAVSSRQPSGELDKMVAPVLVSHDSFFGGLSGVMNGVTLEGPYFETVSMIGLGAGGEATASAVISDIVSIVRHGNLVPSLGRPASLLKSADALPGESSGDKEDGQLDEFFFAFDIKVGGSSSDFADIFSEKGVKVAKMHQHSFSGNHDTVFFITEPICKEAVDFCVDGIKKSLGDLLAGSVTVLRVYG